MRNPPLDYARERLDIVLLFVVFAAFALMAYDLPEIPRTFPMVFLVLGMLFLVLEFSIDLLPPRTARVMRELTSGVSGDLTDQVDDDEQGPETEEEPMSDEGRINDQVKIGLILLGLMVLTQLVGFLISVILFVPVTLYLIGDRSSLRIAIVTVILTAIVYAVFGELFNVPIMEGEFSYLWRDLL